MSDRAEAVTVLVVEDEALVRMHATLLLEDAGFSVLQAGSADEALAVLADQDGVEVLFSDIDMPGSMDGLHLAKHVHEQWPHIRLVITSGHHRCEDHDVPGTGRFLRKPWIAGALIQQIENVLAD